ncbi:hypothetical protein BDZ97DRAFT_1918966 [Flammula alnicola]|nr:hypothetical protein BDZ97DRAFT_1918966 [Flammula alnicola]
MSSYAPRKSSCTQLLPDMARLWASALPRCSTVLELAARGLFTGAGLATTAGPGATADADADFYDADPATLLEFKRVHWLRAQAQRQLWHEELTLVAYEMQWTALTVISKADAEMQRWMQYCLREELFYVLGFVGAATAVGQVVEVPILIRSLADNLAHARWQLLPMAFHSSLLAALDAGIDADSPAALVPTYAFDWWNGDAPPERLECLTFTTIQTALDVHHKQHPTVRQGRQLIPTPQAKFGLRSTADCERCRGNEDLTQDLITELQSIYQLADGMEAKTANRLAQDMRKAQSLHVLHEQSLFKELGSAPASAAGPGPAVEPLLKLLSQPASGSRGDAPAVSINRKSKAVAAQARSELQRLTSLPPSSLKWVWGADLTEEEVLMLTNSKGKQHSGYNESLPLGAMRRKDTVPSALWTGSAQFTGLAPDLMSVPDAQPYPPWHNDPHFTTLPSDGRASLPQEMTRPVPTNADAGLAGRAEPGDTLPPTSGTDPLTEANLMALTTSCTTPLYVTADDAGDIWSDASSGIRKTTFDPDQLR